MADNIIKQDDRMK